MDVMFKNDRERKLFNNSQKLRTQFGDTMEKKIAMRLTSLRVVDNLEIMRNLPGRCHELKGERRFELSLDLVHPLRLLFEAFGDYQHKEDGGLDWSSVNSVRILGVEDTHE